MDPTIRFHPLDDSPWDLGHGLAAVGPGWWPLVREVFALAATDPRAVVTLVRQKHCWLKILIWHPTGWDWAEYTARGAPPAERADLRGLWFSGRTRIRVHSSPGPDTLPSV
jgi:hypothetical protein